MAQYWWIGGSGSQSYNNGNNWSLSRGGAAAGAVPGSGDTAWILDGTSQINQGLTGHQATAVIIGFNGSIGGAGGPLEVACTLGYVVNNLGGESYLGGQAAKVWLMHTNGATVHWSGTVSEQILCGSSGTLICTSAAGASIETAGMGVELSSDCAEVIVYGGLTRFSADVGTLDVRAGMALCAQGGEVSTLLRVGPDAKYLHQSNGTIAALLALPDSTLSAAGAVSNFTITDGTRWPSAKVFTDAAGITITGLGDLETVGSL